MGLRTTDQLLPILHVELQRIGFLTSGREVWFGGLDLKSEQT